MKGFSPYGFITIAIVCDAGPGIHVTIPRNPKLSDVKHKAPSAIIRLACEEGITGTGTVGRGVGLSMLSEFCSERNAEGVSISDGGLCVQVGDLFLGRRSAHSVDGTIVGLKMKL